MSRKLSIPTQMTLAGLGVGIVGLLIQWVADPAKFGGAHRTFGLSVPPGILFLVACAILVLLTLRWRWHTMFAVLIGFWIVIVGGILAGQLRPNLTSSNLGTVLGNVVMCVGLVAAMVAGVWAIVRGRPATVD